MIRFVGLAYVALLAGLIFGSYHISYRTELVETEIRQTKALIARERASIEMLQSEWSTRTSPDYVSELSAKFLPDLRPTVPDQLVRLDELPIRTEPSLPQPTIEALINLVDLQRGGFEAASDNGSPRL